MSFPDEIADPFYAGSLKPRRTHVSDRVYRLDGGTEDNDLWVQHARSEDGHALICSVWELTDEHRAAIAAGANIELCVTGGQPPVSIGLTTVPLGKPPA